MWIKNKMNTKKRSNYITIAKLVFGWKEYSWGEYMPCRGLMEGKMWTPQGWRIFSTLSTTYLGLYIKMLKIFNLYWMNKTGQRRTCGTEGPGLKQGWSRCSPGQNWSELWRGKVFLTSPWIFSFWRLPSFLTVLSYSFLFFPMPSSPPGRRLTWVFHYGGLKALQL